MNRFLVLLNTNLVQPFVRSFQRFYETVSFALVMMLLADLIILMDSVQVDQVLGDIIASGWIVVFLLGAWTLWVERFSYPKLWRWLGDGVILLAGVLHFFLARTAATELVEATRYTGLLFLAIFAFLVAPYFMRRSGFSLYVLTTITKFLVTAFYSLVLWGGISAILATIEGLFRLNIDEKIYLLVLSTTIGLVTAPVFIGLIPAHDEEMTAGTMNKIWKTVFSTIILPLVLVFTVILIVYIMTSLLPNSPYDSLIYTSSALGLAGVGILTMFILDPISDQLAHVKFYISYWPYALLLVFLGFYIEVFRSISQMGFSAIHGYFLLAGVYAPAVAIVYIGRHPHRLIYTVLMAMDTTLLVSLLPFVNSIAITRYALNGEFNQLLTRHDMLVEGVIMANPTLEETYQSDISNLILRANEVGFSSLHALPDEFTLDDFESVFGFAYNGVWNPIGDSVFYFFSTGEESFGFDASSYDYVVYLPVLLEDWDGTYDIHWNEVTQQIEVSGNLFSISVDFTLIADELRPLALNDSSKILTPEEARFVITQGEDQATVYLRSIEFEYHPNTQTYSSFYADFIIAITDN